MEEWKNGRLDGLFSLPSSFMGETGNLRHQLQLVGQEGLL